MSLMSAYTPRVYFLFIVMFFSLLSASLVTAAEPSDSVQDCWSALPLDLETTHVISAGDLSSRAFRIEVPAPGVFLPEVTAASATPTSVSVTWLDEACQSPDSRDVRYIGGLDGRNAVEINSPGTYHMYVTTSSTITADDYFLRIDHSQPAPLFIEGVVMSTVDDWDDDDEGFAQEALGDCVASLVGGSCYWLLIDETGILSISADGSDIFASLRSHLPQNQSEQVTLGQSNGFLIPVKPGIYSFSWEIQNEVNSITEPSVSFFPIVSETTASLNP